jgi:hypothetical protein
MGMSIEYFYNANNQVESIKKYEWGKNDLNNPDYMWEEETWFYFQYSNGLATRTSFNTIGSPDYVTYDYDQTGKAIKSTWYQTKYITHGDSANGTQEAIPDFAYRAHTYIYDERGRLLEDRDSLLETNELISRTIFEYGASDNALSKTYYSVVPYNQFKTRNIYVAYDQHPTYLNMINGLPLGGDFHEEYSFGLNNPTDEQTSYNQIPLNQEFGAWVITRRAFEYNADGLPVRMTMNPDADPHYVVTFEYKKIVQ